MSRLGRVKVLKFDLLRAVDEVDSFWYQMFANLIILKTSEDMLTEEITYLAVSNCFSDIKEGEIVPEYAAYFRNEIVKCAGWTSVVTKFDGFRRIE